MLHLHFTAYTLVYIHISFVRSPRVLSFYFELSVVRIKGIYLSKALTCMNFFLYKQKMLFFIKETETFGHTVVRAIYASLRPNIQHLSIPQHAYQSF